nr:Serine carboxypeptidase-like 9 [Ipomoea batatas]
MELLRAASGRKEGNAAVVQPPQMRFYGQASAASPLNFLPGFNGPLPFPLETGYIGVGDVEFFYYFIESESNPQSDPVMIWFSGGPGCSLLNGLIYEIDFPVGTGFSYATTAAAHQSDTFQAAHQAYEFVLKWLTDHQAFKSNSFYVGGDSFGGNLAPVITQVISNGNEKGNNPQINLKGYVIGNPVTFIGEGNYQFQFANGMALISDELYESLKENCKGEAYRAKEPNYNINPENVKCLDDVNTFVQLTSNIQSGMILDPSCEELQTLKNRFTPRRFLDEKLTNLVSFNSFSPKKCREYLYDLSYYWVNDESVQEALHVQKGSIGEWERCSQDLDYIIKIDSTIPYHVNLSAKGYRSLVYRYRRTYSNKMTFATVKGAGHTAPEFKPSQCQAMISKWFSYRLF